MAAIHAEAMAVPPPWGAPTFEGFLAFPGTVLAAEAEGFALGRVVADEAELLTLAVRPEARSSWKRPSRRLIRYRPR